MTDSCAGNQRKCSRVRQKCAVRRGLVHIYDSMTEAANHKIRTAPDRTLDNLSSACSSHSEPWTKLEKKLQEMLLTWSFWMQIDCYLKVRQLFYVSRCPWNSSAVTSVTLVPILCLVQPVQVNLIKIYVNSGCNFIWQRCTCSNKTKDTSVF